MIRMNYELFCKKYSKVSNPVLKVIEHKVKAAKFTTSQQRIYVIQQFSVVDNDLKIVHFPSHVSSAYQIKCHWKTEKYL